MEASPVASDKNNKTNHNHSVASDGGSNDSNSNGEGNGDGSLDHGADHQEHDMNGTHLVKQIKNGVHEEVEDAFKYIDELKGGDNDDEDDDGNELDSSHPLAHSKTYIPSWIDTIDEGDEKNFEDGVDVENQSNEDENEEEDDEEGNGDGNGNGSRGRRDSKASANSDAKKKQQQQLQRNDSPNHKEQLDEDGKKQSNASDVLGDTVAAINGQLIIPAVLKSPGRRGSGLEHVNPGAISYANLDSAAVGDYDMKRSPSTAAFLTKYIEDRALYKAQQNLRQRAKLDLLNTAKKTRSPDVSPSLPISVPVELKLPDAPQEITTVDGKQATIDAKSPVLIPAAVVGIAPPIALETQPVVEEKSDDQTKSIGANAVLSSVTGVFMEGVECVYEDNFWKCFESKKPKPWNWNIYLWPIWVFGLIFRYAVLFPFRFTIWCVAWLLFGIGMVTVRILFRGPRRESWERALISFMSGVFCFTWGAVIRYHGRMPDTKNEKNNCVFVCNHTTMVDVVILQQVRCFSLVGQKHKGFVKFLQEVVLGCLQCIWFDRGEINDRAVVARKLTEHSHDPTRNPLLVFPEGTCVNNEYIIQFKKGVFDLGVPICPIAIKYNKMFVDPFWNSREQSFVMHLFELMTSWCLICDVWFLEPQKIRPNEDAAEFADRVKKMIANKANLKNVDFDGYMKHWKPSQRFLEGRQKVYAETMRTLLQQIRNGETKQE